MGQNKERRGDYALFGPVDHIPSVSVVAYGVNR